MIANRLRWHYISYTLIWSAQNVTLRCILCYRYEENLLSVSQLTSLGNYVLFNPQNVRMYQDVKILGTYIIEGRRLKLVYVLPAEFTYVNKTRKNETVHLWHALLWHVSYYKLKVMMNKSIHRGLPQLDMRINKVYARL